MPHPDIIVIGGGAIGAAVAYSASGRGLKVLLLERDHPGAHASSAAAGMLAPFAESGADGPFSELCRRGLERLTLLAPELEAATGLETGISICGLLRIAVDEEEEAVLRERCRQLASSGLEWLDGRNARELEPGLSERARGCLWSPREGHISGAALVAALLAAVPGVDVRPGSPVCGFLRDGDRVVGVRTAGETFPAGAVVTAAGAWSGIALRELGIEMPVGAVKGQILSLNAELGAPRHIVWGEQGYLVPRGGSSVTVGATEEEAGFDVRSTAAGVESLLRAAREMVPRLGEATFERAWAGLRPAAPDRLPVIGPVSSRPGLLMATGHFRNGILLSAVTGDLIAGCITSGPPPELAPFSPDRFG